MKQLITVIIGLLLISSPFLGAHADNTKIGVVDVREIVVQSKELKEVEKNLEKQFQSRKDEIIKLHKAIDGDMSKLQRDSSVMTDKNRQDAEEKILQQKRDLLHKEQDFQQDATTAQNQAMQDFLKKVEKVVNEIAEKDKYDLILQRNVTPFANKNMDITDQVIKKLN